MKHKDLIRILKQNGFKKIREGDHEIYQASGKRIVQVPRHKEINEKTAKNILRDAGINKTP